MGAEISRAACASAGARFFRSSSIETNERCTAMLIAATVSPGDVRLTTRYAEDDRPPDPACTCYTCRTCSRAYLRHLFVAGEINASTLNTLHNLHFYLDTLRRIRESVAFGRFESFRVAFRQSLSRQPQEAQ